MTHHLPVAVLEARATEQRRQLHNDVSEFRSTLRERLGVRKIVRPYVLPASGVAAALGLVLGFAVTGFFTRD